MGEGLARLARQGAIADVSFHLDSYLVPTEIEPIQSTSNDSTWINDAADFFGIPTSYEYINRIWQLNNRMRQTAKVFDWWYTAFMIRNVCDEDGLFADGSGTRAWLWGPGARYQYRTGQATNCRGLFNVGPHEAAHAFYAADEYGACHCDSIFGYLQTPNSNCVNCEGDNETCLMYDMPNTFTVCPSTAAHLGWMDSDDDGIADVIDHPASFMSARLGDADSLRLGDLVDIYDSGGQWQTQLIADPRTSDQGRMVWDGLSALGDTCPAGEQYSWKRNGFDVGDLSIVRETQSPILSGVEVLKGPCSDPTKPCTDTLSFRFEEGDVSASRIRATITPQFGLGIPKRIIQDKFFRAPESGSIRESFQAERGMWDLDLYVWDTTGDSASYHSTFNSISSAPDRATEPADFRLSRGRPNPSGGQVTWELSRSSAAEVDLRVIAVDGRCIRSWMGQRLAAGVTRVIWDGLDQRGVPAPSGRYYLVAKSRAGEMRTRAATLIR